MICIRMADVKTSVKKEKKVSKKHTGLKWEFDIILTVLFPFLGTKDQQNFSCVNKTIKEWAEEACRVHIKRDHVTDRELKRFFSFAKKQNKSCLAQKLMFDRYKDLRVNAKKKRSVKSFNKASMSVLIFYLYQNNRRALDHLMHLCKEFEPSVSRIIRQTWLRVQMHDCKYRSRINREHTETPDRKNLSIMSNTSRTSVKYNKKRGIVSIQKVARSLSKRQCTTVNRYSPSIDGKFLDDKSDEEGEVDLETEEGIEERSSDSDSEGSLKNFIVDDEEEDSEEDESDRENDSGKDEGELSEGETDCSSEYSVYSEED